MKTNVKELCIYCLYVPVPEFTYVSHCPAGALEDQKRVPDVLELEFKHL